MALGRRPTFYCICVVQPHLYTCTTVKPHPLTYFIIYTLHLVPSRVFIKLYVSSTPDDLDSVMALETAFASSFNGGNAYVDTFLNQLAINVASTNPGVGPNLNNRTVNDSVHPGCNPQSCPEGDPTLLAIVIGTYYGMCSLSIYIYIYI